MNDIVTLPIIVDQIWKDCDVRKNGRLIRILEIHEHKTLIVTCDEHGQHIGKPVLASLGRFNAVPKKSGFMFIKQLQTVT